MKETGGRNKFRGKQTANKVPLMFLDVKVLKENKQFSLWTSSTNKEGTVYLFSA